MSTPFYDHKFIRPFPVTLLMLERISELSAAGIHDLFQVVQELTDTPEDGLPQAVEYLIARLTEPPKPAPPPARPRMPGSHAFGDALDRLVSNRPLADELVVAFGLAEGRRLYCEEDRDDALKALSLWHEAEAARHSMMFECVLYGFGGSYKGDDGGRAMEVIDMTNPDEGFNALRDFASQINEVFH